MKNNISPFAESGTGISRRRFVVTAGVAAAAMWMAPRQLFSAGDGIVEGIKQAAATNKITIQTLRGNISVVMGSGGNIAVLSGPDGKVLIDAGIAVSRKRITEALAGISRDPIKHVSAATL
jgi:glyoxylase-like metal-dependent hydrolase (beta-lactamase superfamily II)